MERISLSLLCLSFLPLTLSSAQTRVEIYIYHLPCVFYNKIGLMNMIWVVVLVAKSEVKVAARG